ncbi:TetR/AcrR family transcriptional regulator [soil metagenome]
MIMAKTTRRGADRRQLILDSAADLMAERGYPAVSMSQIGQAAGIVSSGLYRHFDSKSRILAALLDHGVKLMIEGTHGVVESGATGLELLDGMIRAQTEIAIRNRSVVAVYLRDAGNLPAEDLRTIRRQQRQLVEEWIYQCEAVAPYAGESVSRTVVQAVFALINSVSTYDNPLPPERLIESIAEMASTTIRTGLSLTTNAAPTPYASVSEAG